MILNKKEIDKLRNKSKSEIRDNVVINNDVLLLKQALVEAAMALAYGGYKSSAVKAYAKATDTSFVEAKRIIDEYYDVCVLGNDSYKPHNEVKLIGVLESYTKK